MMLNWLEFISHKIIHLIASVTTSNVKLIGSATNTSDTIIATSSSRRVESSFPPSTVSTSSEERNKVILENVAKTFDYGIKLALLYVTYQSIKNITDVLHGMDKAKKTSVSAVRKLAERLKRPDIEAMSFDSNEEKYFDSILAPDEIETTFDDIGGLEEQIEDMRDNIILPMWMWHEYGSNKGTCPTGVLLYGSPGTGKTLSATAIAKESKSAFLSIKVSDLKDKFVGGTEKQIAAMFSLARKLAPAVIFIDEIDSLLSKRGSSDVNESNTRSVCGPMLSEWDGLIKDGAPVLVLGATNRPNDIDEAFLRRMPMKLEIPMPDLRGRVAILRRLLKDESLGDGVTIEDIAAATENHSGSDLREVVRTAVVKKMKAFMQALKATNVDGTINVRNPKSTLPKALPLAESKVPITKGDIQFALNKIRATVKNVNVFEAPTDSASNNIAALAAFLSAMNEASNNTSSNV